MENIKLKAYCEYCDEDIIPVRTIEKTNIIALNNSMRSVEK